MRIKLKSIEAVLVDMSTLSGIDIFDIQCWRVKYSVHIQTSIFEGTLDREHWENPHEIVAYIRELYQPIEVVLREELIKTTTRIV